MNITRTALQFTSASNFANENVLFVTDFNSKSGAFHPKSHIGEFLDIVLILDFPLYRASPDA